MVYQLCNNNLSLNLRTREDRSIKYCISPIKISYWFPYQIKQMCETSWSYILLRYPVYNKIILYTQNTKCRFRQSKWCFKWLNLKSLDLFLIKSNMAITRCSKRVFVVFCYFLIGSLNTFQTLEAGFICFL